jgi:type IV fimbrial biogenesis protein FimT
MSLRPPVRPPALPSPGQDGFTIIELLVTIAIAAILLALAAPAMRTAIASRAVVSQASELLEGLHFARSEAMKRSGPVTICKTTQAAPTTCATGTARSWATWMVFAEKSGGTTGKLDGTESVLRQQAQASGASANWDPTTPAALDFITFQSTGIALAGGAAGTALMSFPIKPVLGPDTAASAIKNFTRQVCLNAQGRATVIDGNANCS